MKPVQEYEQDIASIRSMMERSFKFISLSGLSGVLAGVYALGGSVAAYVVARYPVLPWEYRTYSIQPLNTVLQLLSIAAVVLVLSIGTGLWLSNKKAKKHGLTLWTSASKRMVVNMLIPLVSGGLFILIMLYNGHYGLAAPACLIFYGLALIQGSSNMVDEVRYLGYSEIVLGLIASVYQGYGLLFWAIGFGVLHIVYGTIMHNKYDK
jgi:predicted lysophospholipase L1 biosynthesis ABC-type transport system permease subunit